MKITIDSKKIILALFVLVIVLNSIGIVGRLIENLLGYEETTNLVKQFHVNREGNITNWFSSMLLFASATLLALIARARHVYDLSYVRHWAFLSFIFLYMSIDEAVRIHELTMDPLRKVFRATGIFHYAWVIIAIPMIIILAVLYFRFLLDLPRVTRILFIAAGAIFVFGALGLELVGGYIVTSDLDGASALANIFIVLEEFLENVGIALFISALILYMKQLPSEGDFELGLV